MYFNETNNTNIDKELKKNKPIKIKTKKEPKSSSNSDGGLKKIFENFRFSPDVLLICFYAFLLIVGIVLIIVSTR